MIEALTILGIETSAVAASAAIVKDNKLISEFFSNNKLNHSITLMPMLDAVLKSSEMSLKDIDIIAVSCGPGSFTGLRIGLSAVKGLAAKDNIPTVGVSSLEGCAYNLRAAEGIICPVMDAKRQQVYNALFKCENGRITRLCDDRAISIEDLSKELEKFKETSVFLVGDGADLCYNNFGKNKNIIKAPENLTFQRASGIVYAAIEYLKANNPTHASDLMPVYLRLPQAERERLNKQNIDK